MKKIYLLMALVCGVCAFSACSDDDDDKNEIVGKWTLVEDYILTDGEKSDVDTYKDGKDVYHFEGNGTGKNVYKYTDGDDKVKEETINFTYTYDAGKKLLTTSVKDDGKTYTESYNLVFNGSKVTATTTEEDEDGELYVMVLKKI